MCIEKRINIPSWCASIEQVLYIEALAEKLNKSQSYVFNMITDEILRKYEEIK